MSADICLLESAIAELFVQVSITGKITLADQYGLKAALLEKSLAEEDRHSIDRLLHAVNRGRVKVVDELSALI